MLNVCSNQYQHQHQHHYRTSVKGSLARVHITGRTDFLWENLMQVCNTPLPPQPANRNASQHRVGKSRCQAHWERCSAACGKYHLLKSAPSCGDMDPDLIHSSLGPCESTSQMSSQLVQPFLRAHVHYRQTRTTDRQKNRPKTMLCHL